MEDLDNRVAAVTGAASGIGRALALELAERGAHLAISDVDEEGLAETAEDARELGVDVDDAVVDVSEREAVETWADRIAEEFGRVNLVFNNAGVSVTASVDALEYDDFEWLMSINFWGVVYGTKSFLPHLRDADEGHIVNISSIFGIVASPTQSAYNASKFAVRGFTESLRMELKLEEVPIEVTSVHPGGIKTDIVRNGRFGDMGSLDQSADDVIRDFDENMARTSAEDAAETILDGVEKGKGRVLVGTDAKLLDKAQRLMPESYQKRMAQIITQFG